MSWTPFRPNEKDLDTTVENVSEMPPIQQKTLAKNEELCCPDRVAHQFMSVLHATGESAGAHFPVIGEWGAYDVFDLIAQQAEFGDALKERMGWVKAGKTLVHLTKQTIKPSYSSTAYQTYWTGIEEIAGIAGKFMLAPIRNENQRPGFRSGERHLSHEWKTRQGAGGIESQLFWISYVDEDKTPTGELTRPWNEHGKLLAGKVWFPKTDLNSDETAH